MSVIHIHPITRDIEPELMPQSIEKKPMSARSPNTILEIKINSAEQKNASMRSSADVLSVFKNSLFAFVGNTATRVPFLEA